MKADDRPLDAKTVEGKVMQFDEKSCEIDIPNPFCIVIFGASGDLTKRKIIPSIFRLHHMRLLPGRFFVIGAARSALSDGRFRDTMKMSAKEAFPAEFSEDSWSSFAERLFYVRLDYADKGSFRTLKEKLSPLEKKYATGGNRIFYLATPPTVLDEIILNLGEAGLSAAGAGYTHIVIEKPFGRDLESARKLNNLIRDYFEEKQVYRMDHYLAKENVQNMLVFRFANSIFEPLWNRRYIDHVQITVSETIGVEHRAGYYEESGVIRDMFQNHLMQLFALTAMEAPSVFEADRVRDEKVKVFRSIRPFPLESLEDHVVVGQYGRGDIDGKRVVSYREEPGIDGGSITPTFAAMKVFVDNWRWNGVPFYLRSGKRLSRKKAEISIHFRQVPHLMFSNRMSDEIEPNTLVLRVQPDEGINLSFQTKNPGSRLCLNSVLMDFSYPRVFILDAYERILLDCMQGDQMLFVRADGAEETWRLLTPIIERTESETGKEMFPNYPAGSSGPDGARALLERDGRAWRPL